MFYKEQGCQHWGYPIAFGQIIIYTFLSGISNRFFNSAAMTELVNPLCLPSIRNSLIVGNI